MRWRPFVQWELRRRVAVSGRTAVEGDGPPIAAKTLWLYSTPDGKRYRSHVRPDGIFFFLDVAPGRYSLNRVDDSGAVVQKQKVVLPAAESGARPPIVKVDGEIAALTSPGRRRGKTRIV